MKKVTVTMKFEFETEETDDETLSEKVVELFEERVDNAELLIFGTKIKIVDQEPDEEDEDPEFEDEDED